MLTPEEIFPRVKSVLIEALNLKEDEVTMGSKLQEDLGAESIDAIDIVFRLEREFGKKFYRQDMFPQWFPPESAMGQSAQVAFVVETVEDIVNYIEQS